MKYTITIVIQRQGTPLHASEPSEWTKIVRIALLYSQPRSQRVSVLISKLVCSFIADTSIIRNLVTLWLRHRTIEQLSNKHSVKTHNFGGGDPQARHKESTAAAAAAALASFLLGQPEAQPSTFPSTTTTQQKFRLVSVWLFPVVSMNVISCPRIL